MRKAVLDTSFILAGVRQKIDFFEELKRMGFQPVIPEKVLKEIKSLAKNKKRKMRDNAQVALKIIEKSDFEVVSPEGKNTDNSIAFFAMKNPKAAIATLDQELKNKLNNQKIIIRGKSKIDII